MIKDVIVVRIPNKQRTYKATILSLKYVLIITLLVILPSLVVSNKNTKKCMDYREECPSFYEAGECDDQSNNKRYKWVQSHCPYSCGRCIEVLQVVPKDQSFNPIQKRTWHSIETAYGNDLGIPQIIQDQRVTAAHTNDEILTLLKDARQYVHNEVMIDDKYKLVRERCINYNESCLEWALDGWCTQDPTYMGKDCGPICRGCEQLHVQSKCPLPHPNDVINAWKPGDVNKMFERIISDPNITSRYPLTILSRPSDDEELDGPWAITLDNFLNETEAERLIELGRQVGYRRSKDLGLKSEETGEYNSKVSERRTSMNAWCNTEKCENDPVVIEFFHRVEQFTGIPMINSEAIQLLKYEYGQFYLPHHDYIADDYDRIQGVRILTVYLYLNDVQQGGGTNFPELDITVQPVRGRALIWPSVYNDKPHIKDPRTRHQALPVDGINEIKYGANVWIHQREYRPDC